MCVPTVRQSKIRKYTRRSHKNIRQKNKKTAITNIAVFKIKNLLYFPLNHLHSTIGKYFWRLSTEVIEFLSCKPPNSFYSSFFFYKLRNISIKNKLIQLTEILMFSCAPIFFPLCEHLSTESNFFLGFFIDITLIAFSLFYRSYSCWSPFSRSICFEKSSLG